MKKLRLTLLVWIISLMVAPINMVMGYDPLELEKSQLEALYNQYQEKMYDIETLQKIKYLIVSGNLEQAKNVIEHYKADSKLKIVAQYYSALIAFIERDYQKSFNLIDSKLRKSFHGYTETCLIQLINRIYLGKFDQIDKEFNRCNATNTRSSQSDFLWANIMIKMILQDDYFFKKNKLNQLFVNLDDLDENIWAIWLKIAIFYNKERDFQKLLEKVPSHLFSSGRIKELIGFIYYRLGNLDLAQDFFSDVSTVNSENIMGNIYLQDKQWELALGHFSIALKLKSNSINAVNRLAPLYWKLSQFKSGIETTEKLPVNNDTSGAKLALLSALEYKDENYPKVLKYAESIKKIFADSPPKKALQLITNAYLFTTDPSNFRQHASLLCLKNDALGCLLYGMSFLWPDLSTMIANKAEIDIKEDALSIQNLIKSQKITRLRETSYIKQMDIEEMDERVFEKKTLGE